MGEWDPETVESKAEVSEGEVRLATGKDLMEDLQRKTGYVKTARIFIKHQPLFYDENCLWWTWNHNTLSWKQIDETDILIKLRTEIGLFGDVTVKSRADLLEALRQVSRQHGPKTLSKKWVQLGPDLYNVESGVTRTSTPKDFSTNAIPWYPGESDATPTMDRIFTEWVGEKYVKTLYQIIAYCTLRDYPIHRIFILYGKGLNGKSKFLELLEKFIGSNNVTSSDLDLLLSGRFEKAKLYKKLVCLIGETHFAAIKRTNELKKLTGGDMIGFEFKNKTPFDAKSYATLIMGTNSVPPTLDKTTGFYRRMTIIPFPNSFTEKKDILGEIPKEEYHNLAKKIKNILKELLEVREFHNEGDIISRQEQYENISNPLERFLREQTVRDPSGHIFKWEFRDEFIKWQGENGFRVWNERSIGLAMKDHGVEEARIASDDPDKRWNAWIGLSWSPRPDVKLVRDVNHVSLSAYTGVSKENTPDKPDKPDVSSGKEFQEIKNIQEIPQLLRVVGPSRVADLAKFCNASNSEAFIETGLKIYAERGDVYEKTPGLWEVLE